MFRYILPLLILFASDAYGAVSAETRRRNQEIGQAQLDCASEISKTGQKGSACQNYQKQQKEYQAYFKENECAKSSNASLSRCKMSDNEIETLGEKTLAKKVEEAKQKQQQENAQKASQKVENVDGVLPPTITPPAITNQKKAEAVVGIVSTADETTSTTTTNAGAKVSTKSEGLFGTLTKSGAEVFAGLREIIFAVSGFGITAFDSEAITTDMVTDTLISAR